MGKDGLEFHSSINVIDRACRLGYAVYTYIIYILFIVNTNAMLLGKSVAHNFTVGENAKVMGKVQYFESLANRLVRDVA